MQVELRSLERKVGVLFYFKCLFQRASPQTTATATLSSSKPLATGSSNQLLNSETTWLPLTRLEYFRQKTKHTSTFWLLLPPKLTLNFLLCYLYVHFLSPFSFHLTISPNDFLLASFSSLFSSSAFLIIFRSHLPPPYFTIFIFHFNLFHFLITVAFLPFFLLSFFPCISSFPALSLDFSFSSSVSPSKCSFTVHLLSCLSQQSLVFRAWASQ